MKTTCLFLMSFIFCLMANAETTTATTYAGGSGSETDPYQISTLAQLRLLSETSSSSRNYFELINDIDASDTKTWNISGEDTLGFSPIGNHDVEFYGIFNGRGHTISNLYINRPSEEYVGFFGETEGNGVLDNTIENLNLTNVTIVGSSYVGGIAGYNLRYIITECFVSGSINGYQYVGGIVGGMSSWVSIINSNSICTLTATENAGGIAGFAYGDIINCYSASTVIATTGKGGLVSYIDDNFTTTNSFWDTSVFGDTTGVIQGGTPLSTSDFATESNFIDWNFDLLWEISTINSIDPNSRPYLRSNLYDYEVNATSNYTTGVSITGESFYNQNDNVSLSATFEDIYNFEGWYLNNVLVSTSNPYTFTMPDSSQAYVAHFSIPDFAGGDGTSTNPYQISTLEQLRILCVDPSIWSDNFILTNDIDASDTRNWNISGSDTLGFLPIGISGSYFRGQFNGQGNAISNLYINRPSTSKVGLFGRLYYADIEKLGLIGATIIGNEYVGAFIGNSSSSSISECFTSGSVTGNEFVGGFFGSCSSTTINNSFSNCNLTGTKYVAGISSLSSSSGKITNCYAAGLINCTSNIGGLVSLNYTDITITNSYWDQSTIGSSPYNTSGTALNTSEFANENSFTDWDFDKTWVIAVDNRIDNINQRPYLRSNFYDYEVTIASSYSIGISYKGQSFYNENDNVSIEAEYNDIYSFDGWYLNGTIVSTDNPYTFTLPDSSQTYEAVFSLPAYSSGDGSIADPYQISTLEELERLCYDNTIWDKNFVLINNIDASDTRNWNISETDTLGFLPIGSFKGTFNGNGYTISNLYINRPLQDNVGLFGYGIGFYIENLNLTKVTVYGNNSVGGIVGDADNSSISKCFVMGSINALSTYCGGIAGDFANSMSNSFSVCNVTGTSYVGGLVGRGSYGSIINCYSASSVTSTTASEYLGGLMGSSSYVTITSCFWDSTIVDMASLGNFSGTAIGTSDFADESNFTDWNFTEIWQIASANEIDGTNQRPYLKSYLYDYEVSISSNYSKGISLTGQSFYNQGDNVTLQANYNSTYIFEGWYLGENLVSTNNPYSFVMPDSSQAYVAIFSLPTFSGGSGTSDNPYQISTIEQLSLLSLDDSLLNKHFILINNIDASETRNWDITDGDTLGFAPIGDYYNEFGGSFNGQGYAISNLYINRPSVSAGLFFYVDDDAMISNLILNRGTITGRVAGALAVRVSNATIFNVTSSCDLHGNYVGGLIGEVVSGSTISNCYTTGMVQGTNYSGGFTAYSYNATLNNCYANGAVYGINNEYLGGFYAENGDSQGLETKNSYSTGFVHGTADSIDVYAGYKDSAAILTNVYFDRETSGFSDSKYSELTGLTTDEFKDFNNFSGFDFGTTDEAPWVSNPNGRPYLYWQKVAVSNGVVKNDQLEGYVVADALVSVTETGVRYTNSSVVDWQYLQTGTSAGAISTTIPVSNAAGTCYAQAYAKDSDGIYYFGDMVGYTVYKLSVSSAENGTILGDTVQYLSANGQATAVTAVADNEYGFSEWQDTSGVTISTANPFILTNIISDTSIVAVFSYHTYATYFKVSGNGTLSGDTVQAINHTESASQVAAIAGEGSYFSEWRSANGTTVSATNPFTLTGVISDTTIYAVFELNTYQVSFSAGVNGTITGNTVQTIEYNKSSSEVTAVANDGYFFNEWQNVDGTIFSSTQALVIDSVQGNISVTAIFSDKEPLGIDNDKTLDLVIYPNPTTGILNIELPKAYEEAKLTIYSIAGELVYSNPSFNGGVVNVSELNQGLYIVKVNAHDRVSISKILKQ